MDKSLGEKIKNYFSDRIEEIQDGTFIPHYERFVNLPEFSGINRRTFKIARNEWYLQHFSMPFVKFTARSEKIKKIMDKEIEYKKQLKGKRNNGLCFLIPGAIIFIWALYFGISANWPGSMAAIAWVYGIPFGIILMVIGIILIKYNSIKGKRNRALMAIIIGDISFLIPGVIIIVVGITWFAEAGNWLIFTMVGIIFLVIGIILIRGYNKKYINYI